MRVPVYLTAAFAVAGAIVLQLDVHGSAGPEVVRPAVNPPSSGFQDPAPLGSLDAFMEKVLARREGLPEPLGY